MCACLSPAACYTHVGISSPACFSFSVARETHSLNSSSLYSPCDSGSCSLLTHMDTSLIFCSSLAFSQLGASLQTHYAISQLASSCRPTMLSLTCI